MFHFFKRKKKKDTTKNDVAFREKGIVDVTNFDVSSPDGSLGYLSGCEIYVFRNGQIEMYSESNPNELLESFSVLDVVEASKNINNFDPKYDTDVALTTENKQLRISFQTRERKLDFWNALIATHTSLKEG